MPRKLLDLFCGAGGCAMGYWQAGFHDITGVDIKPQKNYPFDFHWADVFEWCDGRDLGQYDLIHASPPCQAYSSLNSLHGKTYPDLVAKTRDIIKNTNYVIENVKGAPLKNNVMLCGTMFGLKLSRHRYFETNPEVNFMTLCCAHEKICKSGREKRGCVVNPVGHFSETEYCKRQMGISWMNQKELSQAIPPAYTKWMGQQIILELSR